MVFLLLIFVLVGFLWGGFVILYNYYYCCCCSYRPKSECSNIRAPLDIFDEVN